MRINSITYNYTNFQSKKKYPVYREMTYADRVLENMLSPISERPEKLEEKVPKLKQDRQNVIKELGAVSSISDEGTRLNKEVENSTSLTRLSKEYQLILEVLNDSSILDYEKDQKILATYIKAVNSLAKNKGFNKIFGYDSIKRKLEEEFVIKTMGRDKTSQKTNVPNAILFFGPTGCGKTYFATALAEQTLSHVETINASSSSMEEMYEYIVDAAKRAKQRYDDSKDNKQRTIIVVNEFDYIGYTDSEIIDKLKDFMSDCAQKYKCTLFLTTNYPFDLDEQILSDEVTPIKVGLPNPDRTTASTVIRKYIQTLGYPPIDTDVLVDELFKNDNRFYSNKQIIQIIDGTLAREIEFPKAEDYIETIKKQHIMPLIKKKDLERFNQEAEELNAQY